MTEQDPSPPEGRPAVEPAVQTAVQPTSEQSDADLPGGQPGIYVPAQEWPPAAPPPPRKSIVLPAVLALMLFLAAGAFVALWLVERGDHKATTGQLDDVRAEIVDVEKKTGAARTAYSDAEKRLKEAETGLAAKKAETDKHKPCSAASRELYSAADGRALDAAVFLVLERCK
jgi:hypothetical protein